MQVFGCILYVTQRDRIALCSDNMLNARNLWHLLCSLGFIVMDIGYGTGLFNTVLFWGFVSSAFAFMVDEPKLLYLSEPCVQFLLL